MIKNLWELEIKTKTLKKSLYNKTLRIENKFIVNKLYKIKVKQLLTTALLSVLTPIRESILKTLSKQL